MNKSEVKKTIKDIINILSDESDVLISENEGNKAFPNWFDVEVKDARFFLKNKGEAITSLNYIVKKIIESSLNKDDSEYQPVDLLIDINGFQKKKIDNLEAVAHMMSERARYFKSNIEIDPMSAFDRRVIHEFLSDSSDIKTESEGVGRNRRVVIKYLGD